MNQWLVLKPLAIVICLPIFWSNRLLLTGAKAAGWPPKSKQQQYNPTVVASLGVLVYRPMCVRCLEVHAIHYRATPPFSYPTDSHAIPQAQLVHWTRLVPRSVAVGFQTTHLARGHVSRARARSRPARWSFRRFDQCEKRGANGTPATHNAAREMEGDPSGGETPGFAALGTGTTSLRRRGDEKDSFVGCKCHKQNQKLLMFTD